MMTGGSHLATKTRVRLGREHMGFTHPDSEKRVGQAHAWQAGACVYGNPLLTMKIDGRPR